MRFVLAAASLPFLIAGCAPSAGTGNTATDLNAAAERGQADVDAYAQGNAAAATPPATIPTASEAPLAPAEPGQPGGLSDDKTPIAETPFTPDSAQGAANVVQTYYALIGEKKFDRAWSLWDDGGKASGKSAKAFAAELSAYREYHANVGAPGRVDAGAGQRNVTVPVQVYARRGDGSAAYWRGDVILHRTADVDGATAAQKAWHIRAIDLTPAPGKAGGPAGIDQAPPTAGATPDRGGAGDAASAIAAARYRCMDGAKIAVSYDNRANTATITRNGRPLPTLADKRPPSGIWYARGRYELRGRHDMATLTVPGRPPIACAVIK